MAHVGQVVNSRRVSYGGLADREQTLVPRAAVSKPNFASKYAFESSRRDLHNAIESNPLMKMNGRKEENGKT